MTNRFTNDNLFKPSKSKSETRADLTDNAARAINESEASKRREKSERLRAKRLALEAQKT